MPQVPVDPSEDTELATVADLDEELEDLDDDEEERILQRIRAERLRELSAFEQRGRFGRVYPISRPDYTREVTEASKENAPGSDKGTGVVCYLYNPAMDTCRLVSGYLDTLAARYPASKFVSIIGSQCIPNYPDTNLPTLLIYRAGELVRQIIGLRPEIGLDGMKTKLEDIELLLAAVGAIEKRPQNLKPREEQQRDEDDEPTGAIRGPSKQADSDDDLDWDL
ncbi:Proteolipid protein 2 [Malassezia cuniculi]|uniref:Proteolipid protein 2 n=1 Tax=Malassezia cuniculi TaxID=948313 RepID=A0AAF0J708_9BASI|nr:Proteolipid protein 2 [Malassezia cuniculi]